MPSLYPAIDYILRVSRRSRRLRLSVRHDGQVILTRPFFIGQRTAEQFLRLKTPWILEQQARFKSQPPFIKPATRRDYLRDREKARALITERLEYYNRLYNFTYRRVAIRDQKTRWGSCSKKGNLNFSYRLLDLASGDRDYIIVHELCHLGEFNHSPRFWRLVAQAIPDYKLRRKKLRQGIV